MNSKEQEQGRYPGIRSFEAEEQALFFGRAEEVAELFNLVKLKSLIVLFSRSGLGKTSLLKAGLSPVLMEHRFFPLPVRIQDTDTSPVQAILNAITSFIDQEKLSRLGTGEAPLWEAIQAAGFWDGQARPATPVILIDQFEELFNHPAKSQSAFAASLADLSGGRLPEPVQQQLAAIPRHKRKEEIREWFTPPPVRFLLSIRSDRMSELHQLRSHIPSILHTRYELRALGRAQAKAAIIKPAAAEGATFRSLPFSYSEAAQEDILQNLANEEGEIESFQLQIICREVENKVLGRQAAGEREVVVTSENLGGARGIRDIHKNYYNNQLQELPPEERLAAQRLLEETMIADSRRISVAEAVVKNRHGISKSLLARLLDSRLIRPEETRLGRAYEISHDTLVPPILEAFEKRRLQEEREAARRQFREQQARLEEEQKRYQEERRKRRRNRNLAIGAILLAFLATAAMGYAISQRQRADASRLEAENARRITEQARARLEQALDSATIAKARTEEQRNRAEREGERAEQQKARAESALAIARQARNQAEASAQQAESQRLEAEKQRLQAQSEKEQAVQARDSLEKARDEAEAAKENVEKLLAENTTITRQVITERDRAEKALQIFRKAQDQIAGRLVDMARQDIEQLHYDSALFKLEQIPNFLGEYPPLAKAMMELSFYYGESGQLEKAGNLLRIAARASSQTPSAGAFSLSTTDAREARTQLRQKLRQLDATHFEALNNKYYPTMAPIQGGAFYFGCPDSSCSPEEYPEIELSSFRIAQTETTAWQYHLFTADTGREMPPEPSWGWHGNHPVVGVSWYDALAYSNWLSLKQGLSPAYALKNISEDPNQMHTDNHDWQKVWDRTADGYRLPTEAEWEYTAKGGPNQQTFRFSGSDSLEEVAWHKGNSSQSTHPVALLAPVHPSLPVYDMSGNSWEWCWDYYERKTTAVSPLNPSGPQRGKERVVRGGSWNEHTDFSFQAINRNYSAPFTRQALDGFRVAQND